MKKWNTERTKLLVGLILLIAALLLIGVLLEQRISNLLESHLESQMKLQAQAMAAYTDERFQSELARLKYMSMLMQTDEDETRPEVDEDTLDDMMRTMTEMKSDTQFWATSASWPRSSASGDRDATCRSSTRRPI